MNNIYQESKDYKDLIVRNEDEDNFVKVERFELMIEENAALVFTFPNDKRIFEYFGISKCGRLATPAISKKTEDILRDYRLQRARLINLFDITNDVFDEIKEYPSVKNKIKTEKDKELFIKSLSYFVSRHILIHRCKLGKLTNPYMKEMVNDFLDISNAERGMFQGIHQISNKLVEGGLSPKSAMNELRDVVLMRREDLAKKAIAYNGGYLGNATKMLQLTEDAHPLILFNFRTKSKELKVEGSNVS